MLWNTFSSRRGRAKIARLGLPLTLITLAACADPGTPPVGAREEGIVYGTDDRVDVYAHPDANLRALARSSIVALMEESSLTQNTDGSWTVDTSLTLRDAVGLCDDGTQRFLDQPTAAYCSGTLVAPDIVLTVGHCIAPELPCSSAALVFDYLYESDGVLATSDADDVYFCEEVLSRVNSDTTDYAFLRLDRPVVGHSAAPIARDGTGEVTRVQNGDPLVILGFGSGLPLKIDDGGEVLDAVADGGQFFRTSLDTFGGNSGSGVFNAQRELVGMLSWGETDYVEDSSGTCNIVNVLSESDGNEHVFHVKDALSRYCGGGDVDANLCAGVEPRGGGGCAVRTANSGGGVGLFGLGVLAFFVARRRRREGGGSLEGHS